MRHRWSGPWVGAVVLVIVPWIEASADEPRQKPSEGGSAPSRAVAPKPDAVSTSERKPDLHPKAPEPVSDAEIVGSIQRGVDFLLKDQRDDGSWGSPERTKELNIFAGIGSHHAFRVAVTSLCVSALIEVSGPDGKLSDPAAVRRAIERGEEFLFRELPLVRRHDPMLIYNVWAHAYGIQALARMHGRLPRDKARQARIEELIRGQYDRLARYESAEGGWGYYDFGAGTQRPNSESCCFVAATVLVAFHDAKQTGVSPPEKLVKRGLENIIAQRKPDFSYLYGLYLRYMPMMGINRPGGSLGRSQACNVATRLWGDRKVTDLVLTEWLDRLITRNGWLDMGRKRPSRMSRTSWSPAISTTTATITRRSASTSFRRPGGPSTRTTWRGSSSATRSATAPGSTSRSTTTTSNTARPSR